VVRLNRLVDGVLDFARPIQFELGPVDVNQLCQAAVASAMTGAARAEVRLALDPSLPRITSDGERLHGALVNLVANARHAVETRLAAAASAVSAGVVPPLAESGAPDLDVVTHPAPGGRIVIVVRDRGVGIEPENLPRIWEPYFTTRRGGTGLGLAIVRNVIEGLGGSIAIESRPAVGTEVRVELPDRPPVSAAARPSERTA
jgi:signal transduction histidine kinase